MRLHAAMSMSTTTPRIPLTTDWQRVSEGLKRTALALTGRLDEAEELTQQTLAHLLARAPEKIEHAGYTRKAMLRLWLDEQRSVGRRLRRYALVARHAMSHQVPARGAEDAELTMAVRERIDVLPAQQRAALVLRLVEGLEYEQIAEATGTSVGAVRSNLHLARRALCRAMGEEA